MQERAQTADMLSVMRWFDPKRQKKNMLPLFAACMKDA
jgi:hypothetical protein